MRDGHYIGTYHTEEMTPDRVVQLMVGRELKNIYPPKSMRGKKEILRVENLSREGVFHQIRFTLYEKEVLGIFGLVGAGRTEMSRALCGIDPKDSGQVWLDGKPVAIDSVNQAIQQGIVYLTEDRKNQGLFLDLSVKRNIVSSNLQAVSSGLFIDPVKEKEMAEHFSEKLNVKNPRPGSKHRQPQRRQSTESDDCQVVVDPSKGPPIGRTDPGNRCGGKIGNIQDASGIGR